MSEPALAAAASPALTGDRWIDRGAACDDPAGPAQAAGGCVLVEAQRARLVLDLRARVQTAVTNYKLALGKLDVEQLIAKDSDLPWAVNLALELAGGHLLGMAVSALKHARAAGLARLGGLSLDAGMRGEKPGAWADRAERALHGVNDKQLEAWTKAGFDPIKKGAAGLGKQQHNAGARDSRSLSRAFISELEQASDTSFGAFADHVSAGANDAQLIVWWQAMAPAQHTIGAYLDILRAKLARFASSGVDRIGRQRERDRDTGDFHVLRDRRVAWVDYGGGVRVLWFQTQDGDDDERVLSTLRAAPTGFGPRDPRGAPRLERIVPGEFTAAALARSEAAFGATPTLADPTPGHLREAGLLPPAVPAPAAGGGGGGAAADDDGVSASLHAMWFGADE